MKAVGKALNEWTEKWNFKMLPFKPQKKQTNFSSAGHVTT
jgi:hypothetical protein